MKRKIIMVVMLWSVFALNPAQALVVYDDGLTHEISTGIADDVAIYDGPGSQPTIVKLLDGVIGDVDVYQNSRFEMLGGELGSNLSLRDNSRAEISGGQARGDDLRFYGFSEVSITGGYIGEDLEFFEGSVGFIYGSDFLIDGMPVGYGPLTEHIGYLTGTLLNGEQISTTVFIFDNSSVYLVPEPVSIVLLGLGVIALMRRCRA